MKVILAAALASCGGPTYYIDHHDPWPITQTLTYEADPHLDSGAIRDAARILLTIGIDLVPGERGHTRVQYEVAEADECVEQRVMFASTSGRVGVCPRYVSSSLEVGASYAHETLHVLGLGHLPDGQWGIMAAEVDVPYDDLSDDDVRLWSECKSCER
jgi:hypothetical protein